MTDPVEEIPGAAQVRSEVRAWLAEHWSPERNASEFLEEVVEAGWACPTFPEELYGRGLSEELGQVVAAEFTAVEAPQNAGDLIATHTIRAHATTDELRKTLLRRLLVGQSHVCLLYSEPGSGSDLASLQTRADRDGGEWVVNGQKVWTSGAVTASHGLLAARTDWDVPKHKGISFFVIAMKQEGVEARPIKQMNGFSTFNEVFLTDARVGDAFRLGDVNDGWRVLQTALAVERAMIGRAVLERPGQADEDGTYFPIPEDLVALARERGRADDAATRQAVVRIHSLERIGQWSAQRAVEDQGVGFLLKLGFSQLQHARAKVHNELLGAESMLVGASSKPGEEANQKAMGAFPASIGGGTDQIQRNIIAERVLGLPKDPSVDHDVPFKDVRKSQAVRPFGAA